MTEEWHRKYKLARKYYQKYGNLRINRYYAAEDGINLGAWISTQRQVYKKGQLTEEQVKLLESIGMIWDATTDYEEQWMTKYELAKKYYCKYGNLNITRSYITEDGENLGAWISTQRQVYKKGQLTEEQIKLLDSIGMIWDATIDYDKLWMENFEEAKKYYQEHGTLYVKEDYIMKSGTNLKTWLSIQRLAYKNRNISLEDKVRPKKPLSDEQVRLLESIGMIWDLKEVLKQLKITKTKKEKIEKLFLEFLSTYIKEHSDEINSYEDIQRLNNSFLQLLIETKEQKNNLQK